MPIPAPKKDEKKKTFISRCMSDQNMLKEFPKADQRAAVCYSKWDSKDESIKLSELTKNILEEN